MTESDVAVVTVMNGYPWRVRQENGHSWADLASAPEKPGVGDLAGNTERTSAGRFRGGAPEDRS